MRKRLGTLSITDLLADGLALIAAPGFQDFVNFLREALRLLKDCEAVMEKYNMRAEGFKGDEPSLLVFTSTAPPSPRACTGMERSCTACVCQ